MTELIMQQKTFNLRAKQEHTFSTFITPEQAPNLLHPIYNFLATKELEKILYLWGPSGSGKSHILQSATNYTNKIGQKAMYISLKNAAIIKPEILEELEHFHLICLDDIDLILAHDAWQEAIYYCLESSDACSTKIMLSSQTNINETNISRAETYSRLAASYRHKMCLLSEEQLFQALKQRTKQRQIPITDEIFNYIMHHAPRDSKSLFKLLDLISEYSLTQKKSISKKMIRDILNHHFTTNVQSTETSEIKN